jgi:hypothetical protein
VGEAAKCYVSAPYLAWLVGGEQWLVVRDANGGDVEIIGHVHERDLIRGVAAVHVRRWRESHQHETTRPFSVQRRIDAVTFMEPSQTLKKVWAGVKVGLAAVFWIAVTLGGVGFFGWCVTTLTKTAGAPAEARGGDLPAEQVRADLKRYAGVVDYVGSLKLSTITDVQLVGTAHGHISATVIVRCTGQCRSGDKGRALLEVCYGKQQLVGADDGAMKTLYVFEGVRCKEWWADVED